MVRQQTRLKAADNSGAKILMCIKVLNGSKSQTAGVGDIIVCSVKSAEPESSIKKGEVCKGVIIRQKKYIRRKDGSCLRFDSNSVVLIDEKNNPRGTRIFGTCAREVRDRGFLKIASLAPEVI